MMKNPGWIDLQINGCLGIDYSQPDLTEEQFLKTAEWLFEQGTEVYLPTMVTCPMEIYHRNGEIIRKAVESHGLQKHVPGLHLEGPFLIPSPGAIGSHRPDWTQQPSAEAVRELFDAVGGFVCMLTLAAEAPGAVAAIQETRRLKVIPSVGHHLALSDSIERAAQQGALTLTHLGNGCPNFINRHFNPIWSGLAEDRLTAMIITDGNHLPPELIKVMLRAKGPSKVIVTSDGSCASGLKPGHYHLMNNDAVLEPDGKFWNPEKGCLVASSATIAKCMTYLESLDYLTDAELLQVGRTNALNLLQEVCGYQP